jgi:hypothetical protein
MAAEEWVELPRTRPAAPDYRTPPPRRPRPLVTRDAGAGSAQLRNRHGLGLRCCSWRRWAHACAALSTGKRAPRPALDEKRDLRSAWPAIADRQVGSGWAEQLHPDDRRRVQEAWTAATGRGDHFDIEFRIRRFDGQYRWFKTRAVPIGDSHGRIIKWFGSNTDFEENKRAERRLKVQLERLDLLDRITRAIGARSRPRCDHPDPGTLGAGPPCPRLVPMSP